MFLGEGARIYKGGGGSYCRASEYVPPVMLLGVDSPPPYICGDDVCRDPEFPSVSALEECGGGKCERGVAARK